MIKPLRVLALIVFVATGSSGFAGEQQARLFVHPDRVKGFTGEVFKLSFEVKGKRIHNVSWQAINELFSENTLLSRKFDRRLAGDTSVFRNQIVFTIADTGKVDIGPFLAVVSAENGTDTLRVAGLNYLLKPTRTPKDVRFVHSLSQEKYSVIFDRLRGMPVVIGACILLIVSVIYTGLRGRYRKSAQNPHSVESAMSELSKLEVELSEKTLPLENVQEALYKLLMGLWGSINADKEKRDALNQKIEQLNISRFKGVPPEPAVLGKSIREVKRLIGGYPGGQKHE